MSKNINDFVLQRLNFYLRRYLPELEQTLKNIQAGVHRGKKPSQLNLRQASALFKEEAATYAEALKFMSKLLSLQLDKAPEVKNLLLEHLPDRLEYLLVDYIPRLEDNLRLLVGKAKVYTVKSKFDVKDMVAFYKKISSIYIETIALTYKLGSDYNIKSITDNKLKKLTKKKDLEKDGRN